MSEYGISLYDAVWKFPINAARHLGPARIRRHGGKWSKPDAADRAANAARARVKAWLAERFHILPPGEPGPDDALGDWLRSQSSR